MKRLPNTLAQTRQEKAAEQKFRGLLEAAPDAMVIANEKGEIVLVNGQAEKMFGYRREELLGKPVEKLIPQRFRDKHSLHRKHYHTDPRSSGPRSSSRSAV